MKRYIFKYKRCNANKKTIIYKRNYKLLLPFLSEYKNFLINANSAIRNENGEYDANLVLENIRKNTEMLNKILSEGDKIYKGKK